MALVNDDEIEEVRRVFPKIGRRLAILRRARHKGLEDGKEQAAILRHFAFLADVGRLDSHQRIFRERGEGVVSLVRQNVPVGEEEDAWASRRLAAQAPAGVKEFPRDLKRDEGLACSRG